MNSEIASFVYLVAIYSTNIIFALFSIHNYSVIQFKILLEKYILFTIFIFKSHLTYIIYICVCMY